MWATLNSCSAILTLDILYPFRWFWFTILTLQQRYTRSWIQYLSLMILWFNQNLQKMLYQIIKFQYHFLLKYGKQKMKTFFSNLSSTILHLYQTSLNPNLKSDLQNLTINIVFEIFQILNFVSLSIHLYKQFFDYEKQLNLYSMNMFFQIFPYAYLSHWHRSCSN